MSSNPLSSQKAPLSPLFYSGFLVSNWSEASLTMLSNTICNDHNDNDDNDEVMMMIPFLQGQPLICIHVVELRQIYVGGE
jgi:hypothetical protein